MVAEACSTSGDAGIDSDMGIYINGGTVIAGGNMLDSIAGSRQNYAVFTFSLKQSGDGRTYTLKNADGQTVLQAAPTNAFSCLILSAGELEAGDYTLWCGDEQLSGVSGSAGGRPMLPEQMTADQERPEMPTGEAPDGAGQEPPEKPDGDRGEMPDQADKMPQGELSGEASEIFSVMEGGNYFMIV